MWFGQAAAIRPTVHAKARRAATVEVAVVTLLLFANGGWWIPWDGETHYLSKARHFWDPNWCPRDFFCNSADAHWLFYWTFGSLTLLLPLPTVAIVGRVLYRVLMAWAWCRLSFRIVPLPWFSILSAANFLGLNSVSNLAGETIFGGFEAKNLAYVLVVLAADAMVCGRWNRVWPLVGLASAFHILVGGWAAWAAAFAWLLSGTDRPPLRSLLLSLTVGFLLALPGLLPALALSSGADTAITTEAAEIYVFQRLPHHLNPAHFMMIYYIRYSVLLILWFGLCWAVQLDRASRALSGFVTGSVVIAAIGQAIGLGIDHCPSLAAKLLQFYWFRLADVMVPLGTALLATSLVARTLARNESGGRALVIGAAAVGALSLGLSIGLKAHSHAIDPESTPGWRETCEWVALHTPPDALFITPRRCRSFRWYADRSEVVCRKDIPQDAQSIVEWWRRMRAVFYGRNGTGWVDSPLELGEERLRQITAEFGVDYVIVKSCDALEFRRVNPPGDYGVYRVWDQEAND
jgi:hypothetical protein